MTRPGDASQMEQITLSLDHAIFFLLDDDSDDVSFPEISGTEPIYATQSVIGITAQAYVDGDVKVMLGTEKEMSGSGVKKLVDDCKLRLHGTLDCPSASISLVDGGDNLFTFKTKSILPKIKIWSNSDSNADLVLIAIDIVK